VSSGFHSDKAAVTSAKTKTHETILCFCNKVHLKVKTRFAEAKSKRTKTTNKMKPSSAKALATENTTHIATK
jgi:hypothetical protein